MRKSVRSGAKQQLQMMYHTFPPGMIPKMILAQRLGRILQFAFLYPWRLLVN